MDLKISDLYPKFENIAEYNGFNHKELVSKYNMSESYVRAIINRNKKSF
ncbi:MAG: Mor transcription activator family protein [Paraclostridium sp.]